MQEEVDSHQSNWNGRLKWVNTVNKIAQSPDGVPLLPDCIHFNWLLRDIDEMLHSNETQIPMVDTHLALKYGRKIVKIDFKLLPDDFYQIFHLMSYLRIHCTK